MRAAFFNCTFSWREFRSLVRINNITLANRISQLVFVMESKCVSCEVRTEFAIHYLEEFRVPKDLFSFGTSCRISNSYSCFEFGIFLGFRRGCTGLTTPVTLSAQ